MILRFWKQLSSLRSLSPAKIQADADQPFSLAVAGGAQEIAAWQQVLIPPGLSERKRDQALKRFFSVPVPLSPAYREMLAQFHVLLATPQAAEEVRKVTRNYLLLPSAPGQDPHWARVLTDEIWEAYPGLRFAVPRHYIALREPAVARVIAAVARENAAFAIASALPNVIPSPFELPWAIGELASDTALITGNQVRMAFMIAAASDAAVGWREQKGQIAVIAGSAFGWRALARELAGKLPGGAGLVAKGLIAYSGTMAVGRGLAHYHRAGRHFTRSEKRQAYEEAFRSGRKLVEDIVRKGLKVQGSKGPKVTGSALLDLSGARPLDP